LLVSSPIVLSDESLPQFVVQYQYTSFASSVQLVVDHSQYLRQLVQPDCRPLYAPVHPDCLGQLIESSEAPSYLPSYCEAHKGRVCSLDLPSSLTEPCLPWTGTRTYPCKGRTQEYVSTSPSFFEYSSSGLRILSREQYRCCYTYTTILA